MPFKCNIKLSPQNCIFVDFLAVKVKVNPFFPNVAIWQHSFLIVTIVEFCCHLATLGYTGS